MPKKGKPKPPSVVGGFPLPPEDLSEAEGKLWATFPKPGWIGESDVIAVRAAVVTYARILAMQPEARLGDVRVVEQESKLWGRLMGMLAVLGLTPSDRSKMSIPEGGMGEGDKWAGLLS